MAKDMPLEVSAVDSRNCVIHDFEGGNQVPEHEWEPLPRLVTETVEELFYFPIDMWRHMGPVWDGYRRPFASVGINLCQLTPSNVWSMPKETAAACYPFAHRCRHESAQEPGRFLLERFACAQDDKQRDLVIKLVDKGTMEHRIYRYLAECKALYDGRSPMGVLPPTAILGSPHTFAFVAMPMWGTRFRLNELDTIRQVMTFIRCTLSGLSFLHQHRIAHRDIDTSNILINWYCNNVVSACGAQSLREHYRSPAAAYALFDFDHSLQLPLDTSLKDCRRPAPEAFTGKQAYSPGDIYQGERHYNPFAFDVACLGNLYLCWFKEAMLIVPLLAPLIGKMTTHIVDERWTAEEALTFFDELPARLPADVLDSGVSLAWDVDPMDDPGLYWDRLSPEFQSSWKSHQPPPLSWITRLLRWVNTTEIGWAIVPAVRRYLSI